MTEPSSNYTLDEVRTRHNDSNELNSQFMYPDTIEATATTPSASAATAADITGASLHFHQSPKKQVLVDKSKILEQTIKEFSEASSDLSKVQSQLAVLNTEGNAARSSSPLSSLLPPLAHSSAAKHQQQHMNDHNDENRRDVSVKNINLSSLLHNISYDTMHKHPSSHTTFDINDQIGALQLQLNKHREVEETHRQKHNYCKGELQDTWDQLISMRKYIELAKSSIEEAAIEELTTCTNGVNLADATDGHAHIIMEKLKLKDVLKKQVLVSEDNLNGARKRLTDSTNVLVNATNSSSNSKSTSSLSSMEARQSLVVVAQQLEEYEVDYLMYNQELQALDAELEVMLKHVMKDGKETPNSYESSPGGSSISFDDVLSGRSRVIRMNGEYPKEYRLRLQKRLSNLLVLDTQLQNELEHKTENVRIARDSLRESEVHRLRCELQLTNLLGKVKQCEVDDLHHALQEAHNSSVSNSMIDLKQQSQSPIFKENILSPVPTSMEKHENVTNMLRKDLSGIHGYTDNTRGRGRGLSFGDTSSSHTTSVVAYTTPPPKKSSDPSAAVVVAGDTTIRKARHNSIIDIVGRLEHLAGELEDSKKDSKESKIKSHRTLLDVLERQQKEIDALRGSHAHATSATGALKAPFTAGKIKQSHRAAFGGLDNNPKEDRFMRATVNNSIDRDATCTGNSGTGASPQRRQQGSRSRSASPTRVVSPGKVDKASSTPHTSSDRARQSSPSFTIPPPVPVSSHRLSSQLLQQQQQLRDRSPIYRVVSPSRHEGTLDSLIAKREKYKQKLSEVESKELVDPVTGISHDRHARSLGYVEVTVISAKNLPEMKRMTRSADPYVEVCLASTNSTWGEVSCMAVIGDAPEGLNMIDSTDAAKQTTTKWKTRFPEWREYFKLSPVTDLQQMICIRIRDCSKMGIKHDELIGTCTIPLTELLDQQKKKIWIPLQAPEVRKISSGKMADDCAINLEVRLFYSKCTYWHRQIEQLDKFISSGKYLGNSSASIDYVASNKRVSPISSHNSNRIASPSVSVTSASPDIKATACTTGSISNSNSDSVFNSSATSNNTIAYPGSIVRSKLLGLREKDRQCSYNTTAARTRTLFEPMLSRRERLTDEDKVTRKVKSNSIHQPAVPTVRAASPDDRTSRSKAAALSADRPAPRRSHSANIRSVDDILAQVPKSNQSTVTSSAMSNAPIATTAVSAVIPSSIPTTATKAPVTGNASTASTAKKVKLNLNIFRGSSFAPVTHTLTQAQQSLKETGKKHKSSTFGFGKRM